MSTNKQPKNEMLIDLGIVIRRLRLKKGFRSAELFSYEFNLNRTAYWRWENGQNITMKNFFRLCAIHQLSPKTVFEMMEPGYSKQQGLQIAAEPKIQQSEDKSSLYEH